MQFAAAWAATVPDAPSLRFNSQQFPEVAPTNYPLPCPTRGCDAYGDLRIPQALNSSGAPEWCGSQNKRTQTQQVQHVETSMEAARRSSQAGQPRPQIRQATEVADTDPTNPLAPDTPARDGAAAHPEQGN